MRQVQVALNDEMAQKLEGRASELGLMGDSEPGWPIDPYKEQVILRPEEYQERVRAIKVALEETRD